ncbi:M50 family metallopeptidase [Aurantiacibacter sp. D1-12]|uniref:M50 family metallopeptidase n=1 Tax=Aurantiacibacter sp. D1-12 TaxID=2993658 RepID=UPI00237C85C4|nr:M50 family metallopeptidase [Aurantiacibacter sp. D1-12]MDE1467362.1 M50 family metallopeptidase [Aurantiacibacter sp. D1-12]
MPYRVRAGSQEEKIGRLILAGVLVTFLPSVPLGNYLLYPFTILTTWFHEMGHGLTGVMLGMNFEQLVITPNGSGYAETTSSQEIGNVQRALIAAGGPLGPSLMGALLILASSRHQWWKPALLALAAALVGSTLIWVRSITGLVVLPLVAATLVWIALKGKDWLVLFAVQFLGVLAALSMFRDWDYLFSESGVIAGRTMVSDTGAMEQALVLPHWIWASLIIILSGLMIGTSLKYALNREG